MRPTRKQQVNDVLLTLAAALILLGVLAAAAALSADGAEPVPRSVQTTIYSIPRCAPCLKLIEGVRETLPAEGWIVRDAGDRDAGKAHILIQKTRLAISPEITLYPTTVIRRDGVEVERLAGGITLKELTAAIDRHSRAPP